MWLLVLALSCAQAAPPEGAAAGLEKPKVVYRPSIDLPITLAALAAAQGLTAGQVYPSEPFKTPVLVCRWCDGVSGANQRLNSIDRWASGARTDATWAGKASWGTLSATLGVSVLALTVSGGLDKGERWNNAGISAESLAITLAVTNLTKILVRRARPYTHDSSYTGLTRSDDNWSYFSGHTAVAFAAVTSSARLAGFRDKTTSRRKKILAIGLPLAAATGYLRIAAGKHYFTDVATGAAVGSVVGFMVPGLHVGKKRAAITVVPTPTSGAVTLSW